MDMKLEDIQKIISQPDFDILKALIEHHQQLTRLSEFFVFKNKRMYFIVWYR